MKKSKTPTDALMMWESWGAYHHARLAAAKAGFSKEHLTLAGVEVFRSSADYLWIGAGKSDSVISLRVPLWRVPVVRWTHTAVSLIALFRRTRPTACFIPSYNGWAGVALVTCKVMGVRPIMMNETHADTAQQRSYLLRVLKRKVVHAFSSALVGGEPHKRYFASLGFDPERIFVGYDAVDNAYFDSAARSARAEDRIVDTRTGPTYFLNVGRFVEKKNLRTLLYAYEDYWKGVQVESRPVPRLVLAGYGPDEASLRLLAAEICSRTSMPIEQIVFLGPQSSGDVAALMASAIAFILPSTTEEWGLVVNEAMSAGCPVLVSSSVGCVEDLVEDGTTGMTFDPADSRALARLLYRIWDDEALRKQLICGARARIGEFGCERFARGAIDAFHSAGRADKAN